MATTIWGNVNANDSYGEQAYFTYNVSETGSKYTISIQAGIKATTKAISIPATTDYLYTDVYVAAYNDEPSSFMNQPFASYTSGQAGYSLAKGATRQHINTTVTVEKSKEYAQSKKISIASNISTLSSLNIDRGSVVGHTFTIPIKSQYTISFNANGGSGTTPSSMSKWDGESITLPNNELTRSGYDFVGWGTTPSGGTVYPEGATYNGNANATLYAVWQSNYVAPTISNLVAYRSTSAGVESDDDTYARVTFNYTEPELDHETYSSYEIKVGYKQQSASTYTYQTVTGSSGTVDVVLSNIAAEYPYDIQAVISPTNIADVTRNTYVAEAYYVMDINSDGSGIAFGKASDQIGFECAMDARFMQSVQFALDTTATSGTDKDIYDALVELGWDSDVIV